MERASELLQQASELLRTLANTQGVSNAPLPAILDTGTTAVRVQPPETPTARAPGIIGRRPLGSSTPQSNPSSTFALAEVRSLFSPYDRPTSVSRRGRNSGARQTVDRSWRQKFHCLGHPEMRQVPSTTEKLELTNAGLGLEVIDLRMSLQSADIEAILKEKYPPLCNASQIELMMTVGRGRCPPLVPVSNSEPIPSASYLQVVCRRECTLYVRPSERNLQFRAPATDISSGIPIAEAENISQNVPTHLDTDNNDDGPGVFGSSEESAEQFLALIDDTSNETISHGNVLANLRNSSYDVSAIGAVPEDQEDLVTMDDLRRRTYEENPGTQPIYVLRDNFVMQVLGVYKHPRFRLLMEPDVTFIGEYGADAGALMREYFWTAFRSLGTGKFMDMIPIFEGEDEHKLPSTDAVLLRSNVFSVIGKFMAHSALHTGIAFVGLGKPIYQYILAESPSLDSGIEIGIADVADLEIREALQKLEAWEPRTPFSESDVDVIGRIAAQAEINFPVRYDNRLFVHEQILFHTVIQKRKTQLDSIREELSKTPVLQYLQKRPYLVESVFPRQSDMTVPAELLLRRIVLIEPDEDKEKIFGEFLTCLATALSTEPKFATEILKAWTGWPLLPEEPLKVKIGVEFSIHACSYELILPEKTSVDEIKGFLHALTSIGTEGFGTF